MMFLKHLSRVSFLALALISWTNAQGYGDAPDPEVVTVTSAPLLIDCGPSTTPQPITLPPFPTFPPAPRMPTFEEIFTTVAPSYQTAPSQQGYDQSPPQPSTFAPLKIPTFNELFPPSAPIVKSESYAQQPNIEYAPVTTSSYQTAPPAFTFPPMKLPTFAELFPPAPIPPALATKPQQGYDVGPPAVQPRDPYSANDEVEDADIMRQPVDNEPFTNTNIHDPEKSRARLQKLRMHASKTYKVGTSHHLKMHNHHEHHGGH